ILEAYRASPDDPSFMLAHADTLRGAEHIAALEHVLAIYDSDSREARALRTHISADKAFGDRKFRQLTSPYEASRMKLVELMNGVNHRRGYGVRVQFNDRFTATLLLDTGASGISLAPKAAEKAGLELLIHETGEVKGIGDGPSQDANRY